MSRAARLTTSPWSVYSRRRSLPKMPQNARPVATPMVQDRPISSSSRRTVSAAVTARRASSGWARGGRPKAPDSVTPLLSTSTFAAPSKRAITRWKACTPRCPARGRRRRCPRGEARHDHRHAPHLLHPLGAGRVLALTDRQRDERRRAARRSGPARRATRPASARRDGAPRSARPGRRRARDPCSAGDEAPGRGGDRTVPAREALGARDVVDRAAERHQLPAGADAADEGDRELAGADPGTGLEVVPAARSRSPRPAWMARAASAARITASARSDRRPGPVGEERVARDREDVAAVPVDDADEIGEVAVEGAREVLEARRRATSRPARRRR